MLSLRRSLRRRPRPEPALEADPARRVDERPAAPGYDGLEPLPRMRWLV